MKKCLLILASVFLCLLSGTKIYAVDGEKVITAVKLPCAYTEFYADAQVVTPVFYDTLECTVDGSAETISGFTWASTDYKTDTVGTYTFTATAPDGYVFSENVTPTITVRVREGSVPARTGHMYSGSTGDDIPEKITGLYAMVKPGVKNTSKIKVYDVTGENGIREGESSTGISLVGGVDYSGDKGIGAKYAENPTDLEAKIGLQGATISAIYGGSLGNIFKGTTDIYVIDGTLSNGVYAGSVNGDFEGTTNIYISGNSTIPVLHLGSTYSEAAKVKKNGTVVGKTDVSYKGIVNVYIADDFTGTISAIEAATGTNDNVTANIYLPNTDAEKKLPDIVGGSKVNLYINNEVVSKTATSIVYEGETSKTVNLGTTITASDFSDTLKIICGDVTFVENGITWTCDSYDANAEGNYVFKPTLPGYTVSESILPTVTVQVVKPKDIIAAVTLPCAYTEFYADAPVETPVFYDTLECTVDGSTETISGFTWASTDYKADTVGTYTFTATAPDGYVFSENVTPTVTVKVRTGSVPAISGHMFSGPRTGVESDEIAGFYATVVFSGESSPSKIVDATGYNQIRSGYSSKKISLLGGVTRTSDEVGATYAANPTQLTGRIGLEGTTIAAMYGGSYNNIFKGTTDIYVKDGTLTGGIYAGSLNGAFEGTTNIYLSGECTIPKLYLGSNGDGASYNGTVNVRIADDFTGTISAIEAATGTNDNVTANIYLPNTDAAKNLSAIVGGSKVNLYINNELVSKTATSIVYEGETSIQVNQGTAVTDSDFSDTLKIICGDVTFVENGITWGCEHYDANMAGDYVFTPTLPEVYTVSEGILPTVTVQVVEPKDIITEVTLPCAYTEFYVSPAVEAPVFYDTLECTVDGSVETISGFTWTSADYDADVVGVYTFTAVEPAGYKFADNAIPQITVRVRTGGAANGDMSAVGGHMFSRYTEVVNSDEITGFYATVVPSGNSSPSKIVDATGYNQIRSAYASAKISLLGGIDQSTDAVGAIYAANPTQLTGRIGLEGTTIAAMYGGSYNNIFKGTTDIYVKDGTLSNGIYAGSLNGAFEGATNIYLSGVSSIGTLYLGSYGDGATYAGTINVYIADDFDGSIGQIVVPDGADDNITANIYMSSTCKYDIFRVGYEGATLYIDGINALNYMSEVSYDGENFMVVLKGTDKADLKFDGTLKIIYGGKEYIETAVTWSCDNYSADIPGLYTFKPVLPSTYEPVNEPVLPEIKVAVVEEGGIRIESIDVGVALETRLPEGVAALNTPTNAMITYIYAGEKHETEISISYDVEGYSPERGTYVLSVDTVEAPFALPQEVAETAEIKVEVADVTYHRSGDVYRFENAMISVLAEDRGDYTITDASGLYTYYDDVAVIYAMEISGKNPGVIIESPVVYVESDITFKDIQGTANAEVAKSLVTKIRTEIPEQVMVNGILLSDFSEKTVTEASSIGDTDATSTKGTFYFNGIPGIIVRGEDGGTYAYRSYDMKKLSETNLAGWDVSGGSYGEDSVTQVANVRFESGTVNRLFGGGQGTTLDATIVLDGGAAGYAIYGGAVMNGEVLKATVVYEYGDAKKVAFVGGAAGSVLGDKNKAYEDGEYSVEVWFFDFAVHQFYIGGQNGGDIYGNVKLEQHDGIFLRMYIGGHGAESGLYGDLDFTAYGGMCENDFVQRPVHYGDARLKLHEGFHLSGNAGPETFLKQNSSQYKFDVEYFSYPDKFQFVEYTDNRAEVVDTSEDAGKLVVRMLETRTADGEKGISRTRSGSGDSLYITFPNGQNMLIDTGLLEGAPYIIQDLQDLGVTKLDYVLISHAHKDHAGALGLICEAFEVDTFLYHPDYAKISQVMWDAVESENAELIHYERGDSFDIGDVHFDVINPDEEWAQIYTDPNSRCLVVVMTYGESKTILGGDSRMDIERQWLEDEKIKELISDCTLLKLHHHGIQNANSPEFLAAVNADVYMMPQMSEYGAMAEHTVALLQGVLGASLDDIYITGRHGMIKAVLNTDGTVDMSCQYVKTTPYYADYNELDTLLASVDESELSAEELQLWNTAVGRIKRGYLYEEQNVVDGLLAYISDIAETITGEGETPTPTPTPEATPKPTPEPTPTPGLDDVEILQAGTDKSYTLGTNAGASIHCSGKLEELESVEVDGKIVEESNYTTQEGSTIVTFKAAYLERLSVGDHTVTLNYSSGRSADTILTILAKAAIDDDTSDDTDADSSPDVGTESESATVTPNTGDNSRMGLWIVLLVLSISAGICAFVIWRKKVAN